MTDQLDRDDYDLILESLAFTTKSFREYPYYPSYAFRQRRLDDVDRCVAKVRALRREDEQ